MNRTIALSLSSTMCLLLTVSLSFNHQRPFFTPYSQRSFNRGLIYVICFSVCLIYSTCFQTTGLDHPNVIVHDSPYNSFKICNRCFFHISSDTLIYSDLLLGEEEENA